MADRDDSQLSLLTRAAIPAAPSEPPPPGEEPPPPPADEPPDEPADDSVALAETTRHRYLNYALSVITSRALPDIRDGLKPVQRRILYAMFHNLHLRPEGRYRKSAAVVGEVMAKYHPHGDQAIYDAMVRLAQDFSVRYPLVDGQGNFGSLDGDKAAAMRYTEAKLQPLSMDLCEELKKKVVDARPTYDGTTEEPVVLPAQAPQLLINGSTGIAVGMATNIPPHNLGEVVTALIELIDEPDLDIDDLMEFIPGPDFPTGCRIETGPDEMRTIYTTGSGPVTMAGEYAVETENRRKYAVITSIPYGLKKGDLIAKIADLVVNKKVPLILDVRDESTDDVRIVLELKRGARPEVALAYLYKHTPLRSNFHVNLTCLMPTDNPQVAGPAKVDLHTMLTAFLTFRMEVVTRRFEFELAELERRIHILEGFARIFDALDVAIRIIRMAENKADASEKLQARFDIDDIQAEAILETKLYKLSRMEIQGILDELEAKRAEADRIRMILGSEPMRWEVIRKELEGIRARYADDRRSQLKVETTVEAFDEEAYIVKENAWVIVTRDGWIKRQRGYSEVAAIRVREDDEVRWLLRGGTPECVCMFTDLGTCYVMRVADVPATTGYGEPIQRFFNFADGERVVGAVITDPRCLPEAPEGAEELGWPLLVAVTRAGKCMRFPLAPHRTPSNKSGRKFARLDPKNDGVLGVQVTVGHENLCLASERSRALIFPVDEVNVLGGVGKGVKAIGLDKGDRVLGFALASAARQGLEVETSRGSTMIVRTTKYDVTKRGGKGRPMLKRDRLTRVVLPPVKPVCWDSDSDELEQYGEEEADE